MPKIVDSLAEFLTASITELNQIETLFLPNGCLDGEIPVNFFTLLEQQTAKLKSLNLRNNRLASNELNALIACLEARAKCAVKLESINLYGVSRLTQEMNNKLAPLCTVLIAENSTTLPPPVQLPDGWSLPEQFGNAELLESFAVAKSKRKAADNVRKFRSPRHNYKRPLAESDHMASNLPISALALKNSAVLFSPRYKKETKPAKVQTLQARLDPSRNIVNKRAKLLIGANDNTLTFHFAKIYSSNTMNPIQHVNAEVYAHFRLARPYNHLVRETPAKTGSGMFGWYQAAPAVHKEYFIANYVAPLDLADYLNQFQTTSEWPPAEPDSIDMRVNACLALLLELICLHNQGIIHLDVKIENCFYESKHRIKLIDFEDSQQITPAQKITYPRGFGTPYNIAPEVLQCTAREYNVNLDYYACGVTLCMIFNIFIDQDAVPLPKALQEIAARYSVDLANLFSGLLNCNPNNRTHIQHVFSEMYKLYPEFTSKCMEVKRLHIIKQLRADSAAYPAVAAISQPLLDNLPPATDFTAFMNSLFRLYYVNFYMQIFRHGADSPENRALVQTAVQKLYAQPDKDLRECVGVYFVDNEIEQNLKDVMQSMMSTPVSAAATTTSTTANQKLNAKTTLVGT